MLRSKEHYGCPLLRRNRLQLVDLGELGGRGEIARLQRATDGLELSNILDGKVWRPGVVVLDQRDLDLGHILRLVDIFLRGCRPHDVRLLKSPDQSEGSGR